MELSGLQPQRLQHRVYLCTMSLAAAMLPAWPGLPRVPGGQCTARAAPRASADWSRWQQRTSCSWCSCWRRVLLSLRTRWHAEGFEDDGRLLIVVSSFSVIGAGI